MAVGDFALPPQSHDIFRLYSEPLDAQFQTLERSIDEDVTDSTIWFTSLRSLPSN
jgi:hypothetical protein|tara:strand:+ start:2038 stop:2202 length:165 start_codon:yes stop_codon:yes gene_type:complete